MKVKVKKLRIIRGKFMNSWAYIPLALTGFKEETKQGFILSLFFFTLSITW